MYNLFEIFNLSVLLNHKIFLPGRFASSDGEFRLKYEGMPFHSLYVFVYDGQVFP